MKVENIALPRTNLPTKVSKRSCCFTSIEGILKPLLISMKIVGMYSDPTPARNKVEDSENNFRDWKTSYIYTWFTSRVYSIAVLVLLWCNFIRSIVGLFPSDKDLPSRILFATWYLQCALNSTFMVASCLRMKHLRSFYKHWDSLFKDAITQEIGCSFRSPVKYLKVATIVGWILFVVTIAVMYAFLFANLQATKAASMNIIRPFPETLGVILVAILHVFATAAWIFPVIFVSVIARVIQAQFHQFRNCLSKQIDEAGDSIPYRLPEIRGRYTQLCKSVDIINGTFKWMLGASFILQVSLACFISYQIINSPSEIFSLVSSVFWLSTCVLSVLVLSTSSADVHDAAHSLLEDIFRVGTKNITTDQLGQLNLFVAKLTGTSIGFSAIDFFVIKKEFILTLAGLYFTYFFLLLQFKIA